MAVIRRTLAAWHAIVGSARDAAAALARFRRSARPRQAAALAARRGPMPATNRRARLRCAGRHRRDGRPEATADAAPAGRAARGPGPARPVPRSGTSLPRRRHTPPRDGTGPARTGPGRRPPGPRSGRRPRRARRRARQRDRPGSGRPRARTSCPGTRWRTRAGRPRGAGTAVSWSTSSAGNGRRARCRRRRPCAPSTGWPSCRPRSSGSSRPASTPSSWARRRARPRRHGRLHGVPLPSGRATWDACAGAYGERKIIVGSRRSAAPDVMCHEVGHALDDLDGSGGMWQSDSDEFRACTAAACRAW